MKFRILSDTHGWTGIDKHEDDRDTILLLAGDIDEVNHAALPRYLNELCYNYSKVIHVFGNHEYYKGSLMRSVDKLREEMDYLPNYYILDNEYLDIEGVRIIGTTLWADIDPPRIPAVQSSISDYRYIRTGPPSAPYQRKITPHDTVTRHYQACKFIEDSLDTDLETVVLSHHAPSYRSEAVEFRGGVLTSAFCTELPYRPDVWVHGHTHNCVDYILEGGAYGDTRVICNARGYTPDRNFDPFKYFVLGEK